ncbi:MAG: hypothetical protein JW776_00070 [Candidatus Lokiarchaeota archaeon]|nr:hypothetical protein [Candidatus Lokiarchaeota archaeon]
MDDLTEIIDKGRIIARANHILTPELAAKIGASHGTYLHNNGYKVIVAGRDYFNNSRMLKRAYLSGVMSTGINILNLHFAPVPLLQFCIRRFGADGGVYLSSGHVYEGDTGIRFYDPSGVEFQVSQLHSINQIFKKNKIERVDPLSIGTLSDITQTFDVYKGAIPQFVNRKSISSANLKVVVDCSYGPTGDITPEILNSLNVQVIALNTYYRALDDRLFPDLNSIRDTSAIIKAADADIGVIFDSDGSRLLVFDETGTLVDFEDLIMLIISNDDYILKNKESPIITTSCCSRIVDEYAENFNYKLLRVVNLPGEISSHLRQERGVFGAADTFKFYFPIYGPFPDGTFTLLKLLEVLSNRDEPLSSLVRNFPKSIKVYRSINVDPDMLYNFRQIIKDELKNENLLILDTLIGIKIIFQEGVKENKYKASWVMIRPSLHRNSMIISSETPDPETSETLIKKIETILKSKIKSLSKIKANETKTKQLRERI